jgi:hypothetical protein
VNLVHALTPIVWEHPLFSSGAGNACPTRKKGERTLILQVRLQNQRWNE